MWINSEHFWLNYWIKTELATLSTNNNMENIYRNTNTHRIILGNDDVLDSIQFNARTSTEQFKDISNFQKVKRN